MLYKRNLKKKILSVLMAVLCFVSLSSFAVFAIDFAGDGWVKSSTGGNYIQFNAENIDFVVIKQSTSAVIWTKQALSESDQDILFGKISTSTYDPSLAGKSYAFTTLNSFCLKDVLEVSDNQYNAEVTISTTAAGLTTVTIDGAYSHYCYGRFSQQTTVTTITGSDETTVTTAATTTVTTAATTTVTTAATTTVTTAATTTVTTAATTTTATETEITESSPPLTNESSATTPPTETEITTTDPPLTNGSSATEITTSTPPYTGIESELGNFTAIIVAVLLFGSLSGIAVLLYAISKSKTK